MICQRWKARRDTYRPAGEPFEPGRHEVALIDEGTAKRFVVAHHYSQSYPAARLRVGLMRAGVGLAGVAVFSVPMNERAIPKHCGVPPRQGVDLGRFVLLDEVEGNGETWFLARAFELAARRVAGLRAVLSYSDPMPRITADGRTLRPGHVGTIYQAHNARYVGRSSPHWLWLANDGRVISPRALSKIRNEERGAGGAYAHLVELGAPKRAPLEAGPAYLARAMASFRRVRHPGNFAYVWPVGAEREATLGGMPPALPYPKRADLSMVGV